LASLSEDSLLPFNVTRHFSRKTYGQYHLSFPVLRKYILMERSGEEMRREKRRVNGE
jgi:hypothetical protein